MDFVTIGLALPRHKRSSFPLTFTSLLQHTHPVAKSWNLIVMCGITGFLDPDGALTETDLRRMNATLSRRGPDGEGYFFDRGVGLAMRRLAIIDVAGGWQPVYNEDKSIIAVFNGEIYNYRRLREQLMAGGHSFRTHGDSEVIPHLYEEYGDAFTSHLEGMFAVALWDSYRQRLILARDRLGIKPLYVAHVGSGIVFGSEIKAVLACRRVSRKIDWDAMDQYFAYTYVPAPKSIYRDVRKILPAHQLRWSRDGQHSELRYWQLPVQDVLQLPMSEIEQLVERRLMRAIESHMVSDVPVGTFLSGGIDSSIVAAMMASLSNTPIQAFTVGFAQRGVNFIDERTFARELARRYGLEHVEIEVQPDARAILPEIVEAFDEPFADDSIIPTYYVSQATARSVKVAMTGLGGDELFGGYKRHLGIQFASYYKMAPAILRRSVIRPLIERIPEAARWGDTVDHLKRFVRVDAQDAASQYQDYLTTQPWPERERLYLPELASRIDYASSEDVALAHFRNARSCSSLERALRTDLNLYLPDDILTLTDRLSMWHSLELRVPFLDHHLVELAASLPVHAKVLLTNQKRVLRSVARRWIPASILKHRKQGFEAPMGAWLRGPLLPLFDDLASQQNLESINIFDAALVRRLRDEHVRGIRKNSKILFCLLMFLQWIRQNDVDFGG